MITEESVCECIVCMYVYIVNGYCVYVRIYRQCILCVCAYILCVCMFIVHALVLGRLRTTL